MPILFGKSGKSFLKKTIRFYNFENHKKESLDYAKRPLQKGMDLTETYHKYFEYYKNNREHFPSELIDKYVTQYLS